MDYVLRRRHRRMLVVLAVLIPVLMALALASRAWPPPASALPPFLEYQAALGSRP